MSTQLVLERARALERTRWPYVALLLASGIVAAMQLGKVPPSLTVLQRQLHMSLVTAAWVISLFSVLGATLGSLAGSIADAIGARRAAAGGLFGLALASFAGSAAPSAAVLLATRAAEGMAFVIVVVAIPSLLLGASAERHRRFVPALWGAYMPLGMAMALAGAPLVLRAAGWRALWRANALLLLALAVALAISRAPRLPVRAHSRLHLGELVQALRHPVPLRLAGIFACYTFQYLSIMGFVPSLLQQQGYSLQSAGELAALAVLANAAGNILASAAVARGASCAWLIALSCGGMALTVPGVYAPQLSAGAHFGFVVAFAGIAGLAPACIFALLPAALPEQRSSATRMGLIVQASHAGQLIGPPLVAALAAAAGGWQYSAALLVPAALLAVLLALPLRALR